MTRQRMPHRFVRSIPEKLERDVLYVSVDYLMTAHLCACGCGSEVALPLHPTKWTVSFDGATVTMAPSIGSRTLPCRSHYLVINGEVRWADPMTDDDFDLARDQDARDDDAWHGRDRKVDTGLLTSPPRQARRSSDGALATMRRWLGFGRP